MGADIPDRGPVVRVVAEVVTALSTVAVILRIIARGFILRRLGGDDYCLIMSWLIAIGLSVSVIAATTKGLGRFDSNISSDWVYWLSRCTYIFTVLYNPALMATKTAILLLYRRLTKTTTFFHTATTACLVLVNLAGLVFTLLSIFQCRPISETFNINSDNKKCIDIVTLYLVSAPVNILTDLVILFLPMPLLTGVTLPPKQKMMLIATFALGGFVAVVGVMRIAYLQEAATTRLEALNSGRYSTQANLSWYTAPPCMWSIVEVNVGIICACIPVLKPLFVRIAPRLFGSLGATATDKTPYGRGTTYSKGNSAARLSKPHVRPRSNSFRPLTSESSIAGQGEVHNIELQEIDCPDSKLVPGFFLPTSEVKISSQLPTQAAIPYIGPTKHLKSVVVLTDRETFLPLLTVTILFFLWGFAYGLLGTLNTKFQALVKLNSGQAVALHCVYFAAYFTGPPAFSYYVLTRFGFKITIITGLCIFAVGCLVFWPSAILGSFWGFIVSNYIVGLGLSALEISANPFVIICGPSQRAEGRLNLAQAVRGVGSVTAILLANLTLFQTTSISGLVDAQWTYLAIAIFSIVLAGLFYYYPLPEATMDELEKSWGLAAPLPRMKWLGLPVRAPTLLSIVAAIAQCVSLGAQETVSAATFPLISQWLEDASSNQVSLLVAAADGLVILGRVIAGVIFLITPVKPEQLLSVCIIGASATCILSIVLETKSALGPFFLNYFFQAAMFPTIFVMALRGQGSRVHLASALQISSMVGGAIFPAVQYGIVKDTSLQKSLGLSAVLWCFALILPFHTFWDPVRSVVRSRHSPELSRLESTPVENGDHKATRYPEIVVEHAVIIENRPA
ncbi:unnamed protein product [Penicillium glandicola]